MEITLYEPQTIVWTNNQSLPVAKQILFNQKPTYWCWFTLCRCRTRRPALTPVPGWWGRTVVVFPARIWTAAVTVLSSELLAQSSSDQRCWVGAVKLSRVTLHSEWCTARRPAAQWRFSSYVSFSYCQLLSLSVLGFISLVLFFFLSLL